MTPPTVTTLAVSSVKGDITCLGRLVANAVVTVRTVSRMTTAPNATVVNTEQNATVHVEARVPRARRTMNVMSVLQEDTVLIVNHIAQRRV